jgi:hypothetical protein
MGNIVRANDNKITFGRKAFLIGFSISLIMSILL